MTDDDRERIATKVVRALEIECLLQLRLDGYPMAYRGEPHRRCPGTLRMTGLYPAGGARPTIVIRCSVCDTYRPTDDA